MDADIGSHVATCITCQAATNKNKTNPPPLVPLPEPRGPNRRVHCDLWGPVRSSTKKNSYVMVITNAFTKFATAVALPGKEAMLVTDQGREYCNELEKLMWTALKIRHDVTTPYHPACNSAVETFHKILKHYIATVLVDALCLQHGGVVINKGNAIRGNVWVRPESAIVGRSPISRGQGSGEKGFRRIPSTGQAHAASHEGNCTP
jgi:hypothetical protein